MTLYKCNRCGHIVKEPLEVFTVNVTPPEIWRWDDPLAKYYCGDLHFCTSCMGKIQECIEELGRSE